MTGILRIFFSILYKCRDINSDWFLHSYAFTFRTLGRRSRYCTLSGVSTQDRVSYTHCGVQAHCTLTHNILTDIGVKAAVTVHSRCFLIDIGFKASIIVHTCTAILLTSARRQLLQKHCEFSVAACQL
jgi:hypothetical protein